MNFVNAVPHQAGWTMGFERDGREMLIVVAKATYRLPLNGEPVELAAEQVPLIEADRFEGDPGSSCPLYETDYAHRKPACDILLLGSAHAPQGHPSPRFAVGLQVGEMRKQFAVCGPRRWRKSLAVVTASPAQPVVRQHVHFGVAFGGTDRTKEADGRTETFLANPAGLGYWRHTDHIDGQPLPHTEEIDRPVTTPDDDYRPMAFSPIGRNWLPRRSYAGTYDQTWTETTAPLWPQDFDHRYFQAAPQDQITPYLTGGEPVALHHLTPDGRRVFRLPQQPMPVTFVPYRGRDVTLLANADTLVLEPDFERFSITWRANLPLGRSIFDVKETIVGEMPPGWHRARRFPGKKYYRTLAELVAERSRSKGTGA